MQKVLYEPNENLSIDIGIHFSKTGNIPRYDRLIRTDENEGLYYSEWYYGPQEWLLINSQLTYIPKETKFYDELKFDHHFRNSQKAETVDGLVMVFKIKRRGIRHIFFNLIFLKKFQKILTLHTG